MLVRFASRWGQTGFQLSVLTRNYTMGRTRTYADAVTALNGLQTNWKIIEQLEKSKSVSNEQSLPEMRAWCQKLGYQPADFNDLNLVHISGTKGKGSTSAFVSSILQQYSFSADAKSSSKVGLYSSPHLRYVRERIQINGQPLSEEQFAKYFFDIWDRLEAAAVANGKAPDGPDAKPNYFRYLTLMAFRVFQGEAVDAAVIECGIGGEFDCTNIIEKPVAVGITNLGIDHVGLLGSTIESIAWHKGGIIKPGTKAFAASGQKPEALQILHKRAQAMGVDLVVAPNNPDLTSQNESLPLGLSGEFQYNNANLAVSISAAVLRARGVANIPSDLSTERLPPQFRNGLRDVHLEGRGQKIVNGNITWHIDGAHTLESTEAVARWFASQTNPLRENVASPIAQRKQYKVLIFNQQTRDGQQLLHTLHDTMHASHPASTFTHAIFCTNVTFIQPHDRADLVHIFKKAPDASDVSLQEGFAKYWQELSPSTEAHAVGTVQEAVEFVRELGQAESESEVSVLATGSLYLAGGVLEVVECI